MNLPPNLKRLCDFNLNKLTTFGCVIELVKLIPAAMKEVYEAPRVDYSEIQDLRRVVGQVINCLFGPQRFFVRYSPDDTSQELVGPFILTIDSLDSSGNIQTREKEFPSATLVAPENPIDLIQIPDDEVLVSASISPITDNVSFSRVTGRCP